MFFKYSFTHESGYSPERLKESFSDSKFECWEFKYKYKELGENSIVLKPHPKSVFYSSTFGLNIYANFAPTADGTLCKFLLKPPKSQIVVEIIIYLVVMFLQILSLYFCIKDGNLSLETFIPLLIFLFAESLDVIYYIYARAIKRKLLEVI